MGLSYTESKSVANKTILILGAITIFEVAFALLGKGHLVEGVAFPMFIVATLMIVLSIVKAYLIVYEFMHMKYEMPGLLRSVLLPTLLLLWAVIAFFYEGSTWQDRRGQIQEKNEVGLKNSIDATQGGLYVPREVNKM